MAKSREERTELHQMVCYKTQFTPSLKTLHFFLSTEVLPRLLSVGQQFLGTLAVKWEKRGGKLSGEITLKKKILDLTHLSGFATRFLRAHNILMKTENHQT